MGHREFAPGTSKHLIRLIWLLDLAWMVGAYPWRRFAEPPLARWLVYWHGRGEDHQYAYYRCCGCQRVVSWFGIWKGGCPCNTSNRLAPARLSLWERVRLVVLPFWGVVR